MDFEFRTFLGTSILLDHGNVYLQYCRVFGDIAYMYAYSFALQIDKCRYFIIVFTATYMYKVQNTSSFYYHEK